MFVVTIAISAGLLLGGTILRPKVILQARDRGAKPHRATAVRQTDLAAG